VHAHASHGEGPFERRPQAQAGDARGRLVTGVQHDRELVAAQAGERVLVAQQPGHARTDLAQDLVAGMVAERVIELLEAVEVDE
jgi:hypothetical protein